MIWPCLFYVYANIIQIQMEFYNHDYIVLNGSVLLSSVQLIMHIGLVWMVSINVTC